MKMLLPSKSFSISQRQVSMRNLYISKKEYSILNEENWTYCYTNIAILDRKTVAFIIYHISIFLVTAQNLFKHMLRT